MGNAIAIVSRRRPWSSTLLIALLAGSLTAGCAAMSNPALPGIPVHLLPPELRGESVAGLKPIPLSLLGQPRPDAYRIDGGDVLGVWVEGVLGEKDQQPPIHTAFTLGQSIDLPPATGFPIQVERDGTILLPEIESLKVAGMTFKEAERAIRRAYEEKGILKPGRLRVLVSLMRPRTYHILVLREDAPMGQQAIVTSSLAGGGPEYISVSRKGTGWDLVVPAYQNDVLTALAKTGGMPGTDAVDAVLVERNSNSKSRNWDLIAQEFQANGVPSCAPGGSMVRIPLRTRPGTPLTFRSEDVILNDGDVVYIEAREDRLYYTGGLLPPGQHLLPRDTDLDVLQALATARGPILNGAFNTSNLAGTMLLPGIGQPSPTLLTVIRRLPNGCGQVPIRVDLGRAVKDARERILVQSGDFLVLQETPEQGFVRYLTQMVDIPFYYLFKAGPNLYTGLTSEFPGGQAPNTITGQSMSANLTHTFNSGFGATTTSTGSNTSTIPIVTPVPVSR